MAKQKRYKKLLLILGLIIVFGIGIFALEKLNVIDVFRSDTSQIQDTGAIGAPPTYTTEAEGQDIKVPEDVPKDAIKNYELITENEQFKIRKLDNIYTITLYAIINRPEQYDLYQDQLREYKTNALNYLKNNGVDTDKVNIIYEPDEAKNL